MDREISFQVGSRGSTAVDETVQSDRMSFTDRNTLDSQRRTQSIFAPWHSNRTERNNTALNSRTPSFNFQQTHRLLRGCEKLLKKERTDRQHGDKIKVDDDLWMK